MALEFFLASGGSGLAAVAPSSAASARLTLTEELSADALRPLLASAFAALAPGGTLSVSAPSGAPSISDALLLTSGFEVLSAGGAVSARKPQWAATAGAPLRVRPRPAAAPTAPEGVVFVAAKQEWAALATPAAAGGGVLVDEDALLQEEASLPARAVAAAGCAPARKACANCSCGRKEMEEAAAGGAPLLLTKDGAVVGAAVGGGAMMKAPEGGCGNCSKGDAFRCASCPFLGKPAFKATPLGGSLTLANTSDF